MKIGVACNADGNYQDIITIDGKSSAQKSLVTIAGDLTVNGDTTTFQSASTDDPVVIIKNTTNNARFSKTSID